MPVYYQKLLGLLVVLVFMVAYYNRAGTVAVVAVIINMFFLMGVLTGYTCGINHAGCCGYRINPGYSG